MFLEVGIQDTLGYWNPHSLNICMESFLSVDFIFFYEQSFYIMLCEVEENENQIKKGPIHSSGHITGHPLPSGTLS